MTDRDRAAGVVSPPSRRYVSVAALFTADGMQPCPAALDPVPLPLPLIGRLVPAGFPSPADDYLEGEIDLGRYPIERPAATYIMRVYGRSMSGAGIMDGDLVVVDRSIEAKPGHVVVAACAGEMTIKRLRRLKDGRSMLVAENPEYPSVTICEENPVEICRVLGQHR
jgi:DNA polymerase V